VIGAEEEKVHNRDRRHEEERPREPHAFAPVDPHRSFRGEERSPGSHVASDGTLLTYPGAGGYAPCGAADPANCNRLLIFVVVQTDVVKSSGPSPSATRWVARHGVE
jgi:hypothetical protein